MAKNLQLDLLPGEKMLLKRGEVGISSFNNFVHQLYLTNYAIILAKFGVFGNHKETIRYPLNQIQMVNGDSSSVNGVIEIFIDGESIKFLFQFGSDREIGTWVKAINDMMNLRENDYVDRTLYQDLMNDEKAIDYGYDDWDGWDDEPEDSGFTAKEIANAFIKSKGSPTKLVRNLAKESIKSSGVKETFTDTIKEGVKRQLGLDDLEDEFIEMGNDFREMVGMERKMTNRERRELEEATIQHKKATAYAKRMSEARARARAHGATLAGDYTSDKPMYTEVTPETTHKYSKEPIRGEYPPRPKTPEQPNPGADPLSETEKQIEVLKKLKDLLDAGVLTEEEFVEKKKQVLEQL